MKNIQIIDEMPNSAYDVFSCEEADFEKIFQNGTDIEFIEDVTSRMSEEEANDIFSRLWERPVKKTLVQGIHGTLFYGLADKKRQFYPNKREADLDYKGRGWEHG